MSADRNQWANDLADALLRNRADAIQVFGDTYPNWTRNVGVVIKGHAERAKEPLLAAMKRLATKLCGRERLAAFAAYVELVAPGGARDNLVQDILQSGVSTPQVAAPSPVTGGAA